MEDKKNVLLIGFNGKIGVQIAKNAIKSNFVHCLIRSAPKIGINSIFLKLIDGNADDPISLEQALQGKDVVVSAYGVFDDPNPNAISEYAKKLIDAMKKKNVHRLIAIGSSGILKHSKSNNQLYQHQNYPQHLKLRSKDHFNAAELIRQSGIQYTIVCPHNLQVGTNDNPLKVIEEHGDQISGVDPKQLGKWVANEINNNYWKNRIIGVCND